MPALAILILIRTLKHHLENNTPDPDYIRCVAKELQAWAEVMEKENEESER